MEDFFRLCRRYTAFMMDWSVVVGWSKICRSRQDSKITCKMYRKISLLRSY